MNSEIEILIAEKQQKDMVIADFRKQLNMFRDQRDRLLAALKEAQSTLYVIVRGPHYTGDALREIYDNNAALIKEIEGGR